jgi:transcriptional regulator
MEKPWAYDLPSGFRSQLRKAIVGFEIDVQEISGKFKLSQNREYEDFEGALAGVIQHYGPSGLAKMMAFSHKRAAAKD